MNLQKLKQKVIELLLKYPHLEKYKYIYSGSLVLCIVIIILLVFTQSFFKSTVTVPQTTITNETPQITVPKKVELSDEEVQRQKTLQDKLDLYNSQSQMFYVSDLSKVQEFHSLTELVDSIYHIKLRDTEKNVNSDLFFFIPEQALRLKLHKLQDPVIEDINTTFLNISEKYTSELLGGEIIKFTRTTDGQQIVESVVSYNEYISQFLQVLIDSDKGDTKKSVSELLQTVVGNEKDVYIKNMSNFILLLMKESPKTMKK